MNAQHSPDTLTPDLIDAMLDHLQNCFRRVRPLVIETAGKSDFINKQDGSPVTDTDSKVENIIFKSMEDRFPGIPVFGEETGYSDKLPEACWLIDPIDGTASFIENIPTFTSMAVLILDGEAVACAIYNFSTNNMFVAQKSKGAYKNGIKMNLQSKELPTKALCKGRFIDELNMILMPEGVSCEIGSVGAGHGFSLVADGLFAARFQLNSGGYIHDYAPGALLVREAGGKIIPLDKDTYTYDSKSFVACHPGLEDTIRTHLQSIQALDR